MLRLTSCSSSDRARPCRQESNPVVIDMTGCGRKKAKTRKTTQRKKQPWINNGIIKLSTTDRTVIKSPTGWLSDDIIDAAQTTLHEQFGIPGFQETGLRQCCDFNVEPGEFIQILHNGKDHWMTISTTPRCLSTIVCTLQHQTSYNSKSPPYSTHRRKTSH